MPWRTGACTFVARWIESMSVYFTRASCQFLRERRLRHAAVADPEQLDLVVER